MFGKRYSELSFTFDADSCSDGSQIALRRAGDFRSRVGFVDGHICGDVPFIGDLCAGHGPEEAHVRHQCPVLRPRLKYGWHNSSQCVGSIGTLDDSFVDSSRRLINRHDHSRHFFARSCMRCHDFEPGCSTYLCYITARVACTKPQSRSNRSRCCRTESQLPASSVG